MKFASLYNKSFQFLNKYLHFNALNYIHQIYDNLSNKHDTQYHIPHTPIVVIITLWLFLTVEKHMLVCKSKKNVEFSDIP